MCVCVCVVCASDCDDNDADGLVCCSTCPRSFHPSCAGATVEGFDDFRDAWQCRHCHTSQDAASRVLSNDMARRLLIRNRPGKHGLGVAPLSLYRRAISAREQDWVSASGHTVSRRCLDDFYMQFTDERIFSLVCFSCARVLVYDAGDAASPIRLRQAFSYDELGSLRFMGHEWAVHRLRLDTYIEYYTDIGFVDEAERDAVLAAWSVDVPVDGKAVRILCCAEDRECRTEHACGEPLCHKCEIPVCDACYDSLRQGHLPPMSLANDNWTGHMDRCAGCLAV